MNKIEISPEKSYRLINPGPTVLITTFKPEKPNIMTLSWCTNVLDEPHIVAISVGQSNYSHSLIEKYKEFAINIPDSKLLKKVLNCGSISGKKHNKFKKNKFTAVPSKYIKPPTIAECIGNLECRVIKAIRFEGATLFIANVLYSIANPKLFINFSWDVNNKQAKLMHHLGGARFEISGFLKEL